MKDISIAIVDTNKLLTIKIKLFLMQEEFKNVKTFNTIDEFLDSEEFFDLIIITEDIFEHTLLQHFPQSIFLVIAHEVKDIENFQVFYIQKDFSDNELKQEIATITLLKQYEKEMDRKNKELKEAIKYINQQEDMAATKQLNMIFDNVSFHKIENLLIESYYSPKDKLSGDSYIAIKIYGKIFLIIIDAMGKGISASLTSTLVSGIGNFILEKTHNLHELLKDYIEYVKTVLLDDEALCMILVKIDTITHHIQVVNFGMPPIYILKNEEIIKIKPNNMPIIKKSNNQINISTIENGEYEKIILFSDGLIESSLKKSQLPYLYRFKNSFVKNYFLRELIKDFKSHAIQEDDITIFSITKPPVINSLIYEKEVNFHTKEELDKIIIEVDKIIKESNELKQKIYISLQELFLNIFEHAYRENYDKQEIIKEQKEFSPINGWLRIKIFKNETFYYITIEDRGKGFNVSKILRMENQVNFKRFHRRGLLLILNIVSGMFFENDGKKVHLYIRRE